ncbi:MAG: hypothetical protein EOP51_06600 [Sphingobacteriales bacterium]|nr:MAG: hypothetical protein EOP51_06600 [Sphingobacteriales bacterium]
MKKKHLHGKLSLKMKDLSAMNGSAKQAQGGVTETVPCTNTCVLSCLADCTDSKPSQCALCSGGPTCGPTCQTCDGQNTCFNTCIGHATCFTSPDTTCDSMHPSICQTCP